MSQAKEREILRHLEMIARVKPSDDSTARAMDRARQALLEAAQAPATPQEQPNRAKYIQFKPMTFAAIAAMIIAVLSIGIVIWKSSVNQPETPGIASNQNMEINPNLANTDRIKLEASQIQALVNLADTQGLLKMLDTAHPASQQLIAKRLGELADESAIPVLSQYALKWTGAALANPFTQAINQIQQRSTALAANETSTQEPQPTEIEATKPVSTQVATGPNLLKGQITDKETGEPIANATVSISGTGRHETQTDTLGQYSFHGLNQTGFYRIKVTSPGYLGLTSLKDMPLISFEDSTPLVQDVQLEKGCSIQVNVIDQFGQPVKDALLTASWLGSDYDNIVGQQVVTDTDGQSLVGALEASEIEYLVTAMHPDFVPQHASVKCSDPYTDQILEISLHEGKPVQAFAEYSDHVPADGVMIIARPDWWHSTMDPPSQQVGTSGTFTLTAMPFETYRLFARFPQEDGSSYELEIAQKELPLATNELLHLTLPQVSPPVTESITGTIEWVSNTKPSSLVIMAFPNESTQTSTGLTQYTQVTVEGDLDSFEIPNLVPGSYKLLFIDTNVKTLITSEVATSNSTHVTLEYMPTPILKGVVVRADSGDPIPDFNIALMKQIRIDNVLMNRDKHRFRISNADQGHFNIELPGVGTYQAIIQSEGYIPVVKTLEITGDDRALVLNMRQGGNIIGRVLDVYGQPIQDASVVATSQSTTSLPVKSVTGHGDFVLTTIPEGLVTLRIAHPDHGEIVLKDLDIVEGVTLDLSNITLNIGATIQGYVLDNAGLPVPSTMIIVDDGSGEAGRTRRLASVMTDENGYYQVSGLPSSLCYVYRRNPSSHTGVVRRSLIGVKDTTYELDFGVGPQVTGLLTNDQGQPLANTRLLISHPDKPGSQLFQSYAQTDTTGQFTFYGIPSGQYGIYRQLPGATTWTQVTTFNMVESDLDLGQIPPKTVSLHVTLLDNNQIVTSGWKVLLQKGQALWSPFIQQTNAPVSGDSRYALNHVLPGEYYVVAQKK